MRISYVDTAKFIAIFCVVIGHVGTPIHDFLYAFHVQMFFICVGVVYTQKYTSIQKYLFDGGCKKLFTRIFVPYIVLSLMRSDMSFCMENIARVLYASNQICETHKIGGLWFLPTYFSAVIIWNLLYISLKKYTYALPIAIAFLAILASFSSNNSELSIHIKGHTYYLTGFIQNPAHNCHNIGFPLNVNVACTAVVLIYIGTFIRRLFNTFSIPTNRRASLTGFFIFLILGIVSFYVNQSFKPTEFFPYCIAISYGAYGNYLLFLTTSVLLSISGFCLACLIDCKLTARMGKDSLGIYVFHGPIREPFLLILGNNSWMMWRWYGGIINFITTWSIIPIIRRYFPFLIGEKQK